jgi:hypothetical protein
MGLFIAALLLGNGHVHKNVLLGQGQSPDTMAKRSAANNKFRKLLSNAKTLSVQMDINQVGNPVVGHAVLELKRPDSLYFHLAFGSDEYTYTILNGQATEVDLGNKVYDEYAVPRWSAPQANGSDWVGSFFPTVFVDDGVVLPTDCFDDQGHVIQYAIGSGDTNDTKRNAITFKNYKVNEPIPDAKFKLAVPTGVSVFSTPRPAPPFQIGEVLPNVAIFGPNGKSVHLVQVIGGKHSILALLDPESLPCRASIGVLKKVKGVGVIVLNAEPKGAGLKSGLPTYHDPAGRLANALRAPMMPLYYLVDSGGKVIAEWYGFDRHHPEKFADQLSATIAKLHG